MSDLSSLDITRDGKKVAKGTLIEGNYFFRCPFPITRIQRESENLWQSCFSTEDESKSDFKQGSNYALQVEQAEVIIHHHVLAVIRRFQSSPAGTLWSIIMKSLRYLQAR